MLTKNNVNVSNKNLDKSYLSGWLKAQENYNTFFKEKETHISRKRLKK